MRYQYVKGNNERNIRISQFELEETLKSYMQRNDSLDTIIYQLSLEQSQELAERYMKVILKLNNDVDQLIKLLRYYK